MWLATIQGQKWLQIHQRLLFYYLIPLRTWNRRRSYGTWSTWCSESYCSVIMNAAITEHIAQLSIVMTLYWIYFQLRHNNCAQWLWHLWSLSTIILFILRCYHNQNSWSAPKTSETKYRCKWKSLYYTEYFLTWNMLHGVRILSSDDQTMDDWVCCRYILSPLTRLFKKQK